MPLLGVGLITLVFATRDQLVFDSLLDVESSNMFTPVLGNMTQWCRICTAVFSFGEILLGSQCRPATQRQSDVSKTEGDKTLDSLDM